MYEDYRGEKMNITEIPHLTLRVYYKKNDDIFIGVCVDLNIIRENEDRDKCVNSVAKGIYSYLKYICNYKLDKFNQYFPKLASQKHIDEYYRIFSDCLLDKNNYKENGVSICNIVPNRGEYLRTINKIDLKDKSGEYETEI